MPDRGSFITLPYLHGRDTVLSARDLARSSQLRRQCDKRRILSLQRMQAERRTHISINGKKRIAIYTSLRYYNDEPKVTAGSSDAYTRLPHSVRTEITTEMRTGKYKESIDKYGHVVISVELIVPHTWYEREEVHVEEEPPKRRWYHFGRQYYTTKSTVTEKITEHRDLIKVWVPEYFINFVEEYEIGEEIYICGS